MGPGVPHEIGRGREGEHTKDGVSVEADARAHQAFLRSHGDHLRREQHGGPRHHANRRDKRDRPEPARIASAPALGEPPGAECPERQECHERQQVVSSSGHGAFAREHRRIRVAPRVEIGWHHGEQRHQPSRRAARIRWEAIPYARGRGFLAGVRGWGALRPEPVCACSS